MHLYYVWLHWYVCVGRGKHCDIISYEWHNSESRLAFKRNYSYVRLLKKCLYSPPDRSRVVFISEFLNYLLSIAVVFVILSAHTMQFNTCLILLFTHIRIRCSQFNRIISWVMLYFGDSRRKVSQLCCASQKYIYG